MGAYLSQPKTDKDSSDEFNEFLLVGASSMQGWRNSQEDAHNAILNFDKNTAFFAVYDGHGGAEVSTYCADRLPNFLKALAKYKSGNFEQALKDAFLGFDETLLQPEVIDVLKALASDKNVMECDDSEVLDDDEDENLAELHEEGNLPLDEVMEKYIGHPSMPSLMKLKESQGGNGSKPQSPYLRGRRAAAVIADAANRAVLDPEAKPEGSSTSKAAMASMQANDGPSSSKSSAPNKMEAEEDSTVSSSSSSASKTSSSGSGKTAAVTEAAASSSKTPNGKSNVTSTESSSSSPAKPKENEQNGSVSSSEVKTEKKAITAASSSSPSSKEDATVSSGSSDAANNEVKQNGNVESSTVSPSKKEKSNAAAITSTSKEKDKSANNIADDSNDDEEADDNESNARLALEYSSEEDEEEDDEEMGDEEDADYDDDDDDDEVDEDDDEVADEESYLANEQFCANMIEEPGKDSGCTAVVALLSGRDLYVANAGDSRCVVCRNGKAIEMSLDHKPEDDEESMRILNAGGRVTLDGRVNGGLNLSRALGDHAYKMNYELRQDQQMISAMPDIKKLIISPEDEFMVLACDGIWNFMSSEEVVDFVRLRLKDENKKMSEICEELFDACLAPNTLGDGTGCDNMTAVIVKFKPSILNLETKMDPSETEDVLLAKKVAEEANSSSESRAPKRAASPHSEENSSEAENKTKRLKTDKTANKKLVGDDTLDAAAASSSVATKSANDISTSKTVQNECDSGEALKADTTKEAESSAVVSST